MDHETLRHFADSWGLLLLVVMFVGAVGWAMRPGAKAMHDDAAQIPFRNEDDSHG